MCLTQHVSVCQYWHDFCCGDECLDYNKGLTLGFGEKSKFYEEVKRLCGDFSK